MIRLSVDDGKLDLESYSQDATLEDLRREVESRRVDRRLVTAFCAGCGRCCHFEHLPLFGYDLIRMRAERRTADLSPWLSYPERPAAEERSEAIADMMRQHGFDQHTATLLYEYNAAEPITYRHADDGGCVFLGNGFCTNYPGRAYTCSLYVCTMGERLSNLQERIVRQGVWHSYFVEGWIAEEAISHNPFLSGCGYGDVHISDFEYDLSDALEKLFFYF